MTKVTLVYRFNQSQRVRSIGFKWQQYKRLRDWYGEKNKNKRGKIFLLAYNISNVLMQV